MGWIIAGIVLLAVAAFAAYVVLTCCIVAKAIEEWEDGNA